MDEEVGGCKSFLKYHWRGLYNISAILIVTPLWVIEPILPMRLLSLIILMLFWHIPDTIQMIAIGFIPMMFIPPFGIIDSNTICMEYTSEGPMYFLLAYFMALTLEETKSLYHIAHHCMRVFSNSPKGLHIFLVLTSYVLSIFLPNAAVCCLMLPLAKCILQTLESMNIGRQEEERELVEDEAPYPTSLAKAFYIGIAFASTIGGMATLSSSQTARELYRAYDRFVMIEEDAITYGSYLMFGLPITFLLLIFTMLYLQIIYLGLFRSKHPDNIEFDKVVAADALHASKDALPAYSAANYLVIMCLLGLLIFSHLLKPLYMPGLSEQISSKETKGSAFAMLMCYLLFVLPKTFHFCKYFYCKRPSEYKTSTSLLVWSTIHNKLAWDYFLLHGSSVALGKAMKRTQVHQFLSAGLESKSDMVKHLGWLGLSALLTNVAADYNVAEILLAWSAKMQIDQKDAHPALMMYGITFGSSLGFLLPLSSLTNCFAAGWASIRTTDVMLAGIGPLIFGFIIIFVFTNFMIPIMHPSFIK